MERQKLLSLAWREMFDWMEKWLYDWAVMPYSMTYKLRDRETIPLLSSATEGADTVLNQFPFPTWYALERAFRKTLKRLLPRIILGQIISGSTYCPFTWSTRSLWSKVIIRCIQLPQSQFANHSMEDKEQLGILRKESLSTSQAQHIKAVRIHTVTGRVEKK